jgi:excisionase family DNA binding protein
VVDGHSLVRDGMPTAVLDLREAGAYLGVSEGTLYRWVRAGEIPHLRFGRSIRFRVEDMEQFVRSRLQSGWRKYEPKARADWTPRDDEQLRDAIDHGLVDEQE